MTYLPDLHTYLHQSSLLIRAYPTTRVTTKYTLPKPNKTSSPLQPTSNADPSTQQQQQQQTPKKDPSATLTLKTFHAESGLCLKYKTDKAQEVSRLMTGLGRLAKGEIIEMPSAANVGGSLVEAQGDKMDVDEIETGAGTGAAVPVQTSSQQQQQQQQQVQQGAGGSGGGKKKGKKGKK